MTENNFEKNLFSGTSMIRLFPGVRSSKFLNSSDEIINKTIRMLLHYGCLTQHFFRDLFRSIGYIMLCTLVAVWPLPPA